MMRSTQSAVVWAAMACSVAATLAAITLAWFGINDHGLRRGLQITARWSFMLFWLGYVGGALTTLFGPRLQPLAQQARTFGLSFAAAHLVHIALINWLYRISTQPPVSQTTAVFFGIGLFWTYLLAAGSLQSINRILTRRLWKIMRLLGSEYISFAFLTDFIAHPLTLGTAFSYLPFATLSVIGTFLRVAAWISRFARQPITI